MSSIKEQEEKEAIRDLVMSIEQSSDGSPSKIKDKLKEKSKQFENALYSVSPSSVDEELLTRLFRGCLKFVSAQNVGITKALSNFSVRLAKHIIKSKIEGEGLSRSMQRAVSVWVFTASELPPNGSIALVEKCQLGLFLELLLTPGLKISSFSILKETLQNKFIQITNARLVAIATLSPSERLLIRTYCNARNFRSNNSSSRLQSFANDYKKKNLERPSELFLQRNLACRPIRIICCANRCTDCLLISFVAFLNACL